VAKFLYKAKKSPEEIIEGSVEADSESVAVSKLMRAGYFLVWIRKELDYELQVTGNRFQTMCRKINTKEIANFTRQLSELIGSGLTLYNALSVMENQALDSNIKIVIKNIKSSVKEGKTFSQALKNYPGVFSGLYVNLVRSGEESGSLSDVLINIADFLDKDQDMRSKIMASLAYPSLMAIVGFATIFILVTFVVPKLANMFIEMGMQLPLPTRILIGISAFFKMYWFLLAILIIGCVFLFKTGKSNPVTKNKIDSFKLKIPVFGKLLKDSELARFSRTLSMLLKNGVPMLNALKITSDVIVNSSLKEEVVKLFDDLKQGTSLTLAIRKREIFPVFVSNMTAVGEESGFLDKALFNIGRNYETEVDRLMKIIVSFLEPVFILIMGLAVGFIVIAMILPVFEISLTMK